MLCGVVAFDAPPSRLWPSPVVVRWTRLDIP